MSGTTTRQGKDGPEAYVELFFEAKSMTIMVPMASLEDVGIRGLSTKAQAEEIFAILEQPSDVPMAWLERNAATLSRMQSAELVQATMVIRDLTRHASRIDKPLSAAEKTALEACLETVSAELSLTLGVSENETRDLILQRIRVEAETAA